MTRTTFRSYRLKIWLPLSSFLPFIGLLSGVVGLDYHNTRAVDAPAYRSGRPGFFKTAAVKKISENDPSVKNPLSGEGELTRLGRILE
ncbi:hypothetical protein Metal_3360 [Methylomicrobium album BG8]|uniref:Uncharacterized protein n=2 Tax=Methylomicrobium TaxID=39773 RepID=H8GQN7_METAL|nr:hypothetical protein Metal_3360 [Methylomicrobium album BG8]